MAGIYIHIPFCKQACHYCDFHFSTNLKSQDQMVDSICKELVNRKNYLIDESLDSIYFGGGTPSILPVEEIKKILRVISDSFVIQNAEITLEANPDDLNESKLVELYQAGINRLSIGLQTFDDDRLKFLNRSHDSNQAKQTISHARMAGFSNISADLIFALPPEKDALTRFENDLRQLIAYEPEHISLYNLTIEAKTVFGNWHTKNKLSPVSEESSAQQYELAIALLTSDGYEHYEISNFAKAEKYSRHNSSYWKSALYLGAGPGAHSYNGKSRTINVSNNAQYIRDIQNGQTPSSIEHLTEIQMLNEYILTRSRTKWGLDIEYMRKSWGFDLMKSHEKLLVSLIEEDKARLSNGIFRLTSKGFSVADEVSLRLFSEE